MLRMMGTDLVVEEAVFVGLSIALEICVAPSFFQGDVYAAVWKVLVTGDSCTGTPGLLNAANFKFGADGLRQPDRCRGADRAGRGVAVTLTTFERMDSPTARRHQQPPDTSADGRGRDSLLRQRPQPRRSRLADADDGWWQMSCGCQDTGTATLRLLRGRDAD